MNLSHLQADLRHFAAERDWKPLHTPKNLSTALMVEAAELAEIFQWMTPEESVNAHSDQTTKERVGEEVADLLLYLIQLADHSQIDIEQAVKKKLVRNALKYPAKRAVTRATPTGVKPPDTHVLLDYENVQPTEQDLRLMVPGASHVWVFHGPHQKQVEQSFTSFGGEVTAVPISKPGKNALDFHLSFYMGYIASRNQASQIVVVANDKGYAPMLQHAEALGFSVRQQGHNKPQPIATTMAMPVVHSAAASKATPPKPTAKKVATRKVVAEQEAVKQVSAKKVSAKRVAVAAVSKVDAPAKKVISKMREKAAGAVKNSSLAAGILKKIADSLRSMGKARPTKPASLRRALKSLLQVETEDQSIEIALEKLISDGMVLIAGAQVSYPAFAVKGATPAAKT
jgi:NTP pyrophosphatase (non-canonical NTP hydrolase)